MGMTDQNMEPAIRVEGSGLGVLCSVCRSRDIVYGRFRGNG